MKILKKLSALTALMLALVTMLTFAIPPEFAEAAAKIKLNKKSVTVYIGSSKTLKLSGAKKADVKWTTSDKKIATVSSAGKVKGKKNGTATITATYKGKSYTCKVKVKKPYLNYKSADMNPGEKLELVLTGTTAKSWKSSNVKVAAVNNGVVTAVGKGSATITVTGKNKKKYKLNVNVYVPTAVSPKISLDLSQVQSDGSLDPDGDVSNNALESRLYGYGPQEVGLDLTKYGITDGLWGGDQTSSGFKAAVIQNDNKKFPAENGYYWATVVFTQELIDTHDETTLSTTPEGYKYYAKVPKTADFKKMKLPDPVALRYVNDVFSSPIDGKKADKDGYYTFSLEVDGDVYDKCKVKFEVIKDEREYMITRWFAVTLKLPTASKNDLFLAATDLDYYLKMSTTTDRTTTYGNYSPNWFSPVVCNLPVFSVYDMYTRTESYVVKYNEEMCKYLGIEY